MPFGGLLAGAAAPIVGGVLGNVFGSDDKSAQQQALQQALKAFSGIDVPSIDEQKIALQNYKSAGQLSPQLEALISQGQSNYNNISTDPNTRIAQMQALQSLQQQGQTGLNASDQLALSQVNNQTNQANQARAQAIMQNMAQRGMASGGASLAAQLQSAQQGAQNQNAQGLNIASQAQQRALQAIASAGALGGQINNQQFNQGATVANANDQIARFNAANQQAVAGRNTNIGNTAQQYNLSQAQQLNNSNTGIANQQEMYNKGLYQQQFNDQMAKARGMAGQDSQLANNYGQRAQNTADMWSNIGQGVGSMATAIAHAPKSPGGGGNSEDDSTGDAAAWSGQDDYQQ